MNRQKNRFFSACSIILRQGFWLLVCAILLCAVSGPSFAQNKPQTPEEIKRQIKKEKERAKETQANVSKLTEKERSLNAELARAEDSIARLQAKIAAQEKELSTLESAQGLNQKQYDDLLANRAKTEAALAELVRFLWPVYIDQESFGARDGLAWADAERDYMWTAEIMRQIAERKNELRSQESAISDSISRRESLALQLREQLELINKDKDKLLEDKLRFQNELSAVRKEKKDAEAQVKGVLGTIQSLNIRLEKASKPKNEIEKPKPGGKGKMPWPAAGRVVAKFAPGANPPVNGIGLALNDGEVVKAVSWGKVVHNDILRGMGRVVVLMHDKDYYTVYAYLDESKLKIGQVVKQGQTLGTAGYYPPAKGTGTYFELRHHQKAINPNNWLAAR
ncbi:MAG: peptidoglycan DD-metalloendopeptidase family protein [Desulfovibrionaceae bacterium]|nr:peptidoglycan DD-metalloendopeptidase family protein [Desulfovibrionaceae bacterium]